MQDTDAIVRTTIHAARTDTEIIRVTPAADVTADSAAEISSVEIAANAAAIKKEEASIDYKVFENYVEKTYTDADIGMPADARKKITITLMATGDEVINGYQGAARTKGLIDSIVRGKYNLRDRIDGNKISAWISKSSLN